MGAEFRWNESVLGQSQVKRQHYVPRTYLRHFIGEDGLLRVVDLQQITEYRTSIINAAVEGRFYDIDTDGTVVSVEEWLARIENEASSVIELLLSSPLSIETLSDEQEFALARFIVAFRFRTPAFREWGDAASGSIASQVKQIVKGSLVNLYGDAAGGAVFDNWKDKPDSWWLGNEGVQQPAAMSTHLLTETQGFANLVRAAPWRVGHTLGAHRLYTSDNPVAGYLRPVRPWWEVGAFASLEYYLPLSPSVLLKINRRPDTEESSEHLTRGGPRERKDYSEWEISMARHIISQDAVRFLYGEGMYVPKRCAEDCLQRIGQALRDFAQKYLGYEPGLPPFQGPHGQIGQ